MAAADRRLGQIGDCPALSDGVERRIRGIVEPSELCERLVMPSGGQRPRATGVHDDLHHGGGGELDGIALNTREQ